MLFATTMFFRLDAVKYRVAEFVSEKLNDGRIIERGTHDELIAMKGTYYKLYTGVFELE